MYRSAFLFLPYLLFTGFVGFVIFMAVKRRPASPGPKAESTFFAADSTDFAPRPDSRLPEPVNAPSSD